MDAERFDDVTRLLAVGASRRAALAALAASALTVLMSGAGWDTADARRRKAKGKRKNIKRNAFGCVDVGKPCRGKDVLCCSGICRGKKPKRGKRDTSRCVAHNAGSCQPENDACEDLSPTPCGTGGICFRTTGKASFCGAIRVCPGVCTKDADCDAISGPGSACIVCPGNSCLTGQTTSCWAPAS